MRPSLKEPMVVLIDDYDVYLDEDEDPTPAVPKSTQVGLALYRRLAELESNGAEYDVDEVIADVKRRFAP